MSTLTKTKYYVASHTAYGFVNYIDSNISQIEHIFVLQHASHRYKTAVLNAFIDALSPHYDLEMLLGPFGERYLEGVIVRELSCAIITDAIASEKMTHTLVKLEEMNEDHVVIQRQTKQLYDLAYKHFARALAIHDDLEKIYIQRMDFAKADQITASFIDELLKHRPQGNRSKHAQQFERLLGTNTASGPVNIVPHLIEDISHRVYIKGRAGTGKSVFMKKVAQVCAEKGFDLELYHCSFDPSSIDMVIVRELDFCIFDSTDPHAYSPDRESDKVIDLYEDTVTPGTDETYATEISEVTKRYKEELKKGTQSIQQAVNNQKMVEQHYEHIRESKTSDIVERVLQRIQYS